jgi:hypothetical protein
MRTQETEMVDLKPSVEALIDLLRRSDVEFELLPHRPTPNAASEAQVLGVLPRADGGCVRAVVPASRRLSLDKIGELLGADAALLTDAELDGSYPRFELGAVPPFGGPEGDRVVVDPH